MKRVLLAVFTLTICLGSVCWADKAQIADIKNQISTLEQGYAPLQERLDNNDKLADNIKFAGAAYTKANAQFNTDLANFNTEQDNVNRAFELLKPSFENYQQRKAQHDANRCTEVQGSGTCNWYNQEADSIDAQRNQIVAVKQPLDQRQAALEQERGNLRQTQEKLQEIYQNQVANYDKWKAEQDSIKSTYQDIKAKVDALNRQLAALYGSVNSCVQDIPAECDKPAIGPDGKPVLDQNCEAMKAECSKMFDGNR